MNAQDLLAPLASTVVLSTFGVIFVAELPDKTALASLVRPARQQSR